MDRHEILLSITKRLPTDYKDYGGNIERWEHPEEFYPDCSTGCRHYRMLEGKLESDWGVCTNPRSPRAGLLTFEHQAGHDCFES
jgi:hypothetical protein